jgi:hypothetical protein
MAKQYSPDEFVSIFYKAKVKEKKTFGEGYLTPN